MSKLKREAHGLYIRFKSTDAWYLIGKGIDDLSVEMNGSFEQKKDVTGSSSVSDTGYQPQISVEPYYADPTDTIYSYLRDLAMNRKSGDDAAAEFCEVLVDSTDSSATHDCWVEDCVIEIASYGGDTNGLGINYNIWPNGNRVKGSATITDGVLTVTTA